MRTSQTGEEGRTGRYGPDGTHRGVYLALRRTHAGLQNRDDEWNSWESCVGVAPPERQHVLSITGDPAVTSRIDKQPASALRFSAKP